MSEKTEDQDLAISSTAATPKENGRYALGLSGLVLGLVALACAILPTVIVNDPEGKPIAQQAEQADPKKKSKNGLTLRFKNIEFKIGGGKDKPNEAESEPDQAAPEKNVAKSSPTEPAAQKPAAQQPAIASVSIRWFTIAAIACGLLGIAFSAFSYTIEKQHAVAVTAMGCCVAAITWQYVVAGIMMAVAFVVILMLISAFASAIG